MAGALIIAAVTALVGILLWLWDRKAKADEVVPTDAESAIKSDITTPTDSEVCCGMHAVCEKQLLSPVSPDYEYFDDEELDEFRGREADSYTAEEVENFRDVLLTLAPEEVPAWSKSIQLRGITLPGEVRDELLLIVSESRSQS